MSYIFAPLNQYFTSYNSGFDTSSSNGSSNNIYYDSSPNTIDAWSDSFIGFTGVAANIPENQSVNTSGHMSMSKSDPSRVSLIAWKVTASGVRIDVWGLTETAVTELTQRFTAPTLNTGIRFSNVLRTQDERINGSYMDTAWRFFQSTVGYWYSDGRGFIQTQLWMANNTGTYKRGASVANEYDNILTIPVMDTDVKRDIYINHVDETGAVIPGFQNSSLNMVSPASTTRANGGPMSGFQEYYRITGTEQIAVRKSSQTAIGTTTYTFQYGKAGSASTLAAAITAAQNSSNVWSASDDPRTFGINANNTDDFLVVNLVYRKYTPPPPTQVLPDLQIIGRLCFINTTSDYIGSTSGGSLDYIPSTKTLTPYAEGAYPYAVRAIRYDTKFDVLSSSATVTINIAYSWQWWEYEHHDTTSCSGTPSVCTTSHTSACGYYTRTGSSSMTKSFTYIVPYRHTYFDITNFKMYRISRLEVYDTNSNVGGILFGGGTYTVNPSSTYESKFGRGKIDKTLTVTFPSKTYSLASIYKSSPSPSSGQSAATAAAQAAMDATTSIIAADHEDLRITYQYDNDYVELDGMETMLQRNYRTWNEHINKVSDPTNERQLNSTKTGIGSANTANLDYTSNLMNFMRPPSDRRTSNSDFTPNYQTVPANRENGIRHLKGKIYYSISTNSNYNVGGTTFASTDATYTLNNPMNLTNLDFEDESKEYVDTDVNKVNVLTPINYGTFQLETAKIVDHTSGAGTSTVLQKNAEFTITPAIAGSSTGGYNLSNTREFVKGYYFIFNFNIIYNGGLVEAFTPIYRSGNSTTLTAKTTDSFDSGSASQLTNSVKIVAISTNITTLLQQIMDNATFSFYNYMDVDNNKVRNTSVQNQPNLLSRTDIVSDSYHTMYRIITTKNIGRIFDFAVTDCTDLAFKDVFRKPVGLNVNETAATSYYSGYKKWNLYSSEYNEMIDRPSTEIGTIPQTILPLGPYKNTNTKYINAPKMGYRISFDLKTTGYIANNNVNNSRIVEITPRYYYISKDGKTFDDNLKLYYKSSSNNYVDFASSNYLIYFKPNDGYRYLRNSAYTDVYTSMSTKLEPLSISSKITLTSKMMNTNNTSFIQSWYGEYKLPNSTIAISKVAGNINNNVNNPYKDGYIGVIFDIRSIDIGGQTIIYDTRDKSSTTAYNTSQWDYEGFMNFKTPGSQMDVATPLRYQLEKYMWVINDAMYQKIKGTVVLFDLDNRASNDFE